MPILRRQVRFFDAFSQGVERFDGATEENKLRLRLALSMNRDARDSVEIYLKQKMAEESQLDAFGGDLAQIDLDKLEQFLQIIIKYLPQILEIILPLFM